MRAPASIAGRRPVASWKKCASPFPRRAGFTLVETIVASVVAMILIAAVVGIFAFSARSMAYQRSENDAATLASTVKTTLEGTLRTATGVGIDPDETGDDGSPAIEFTTSETSAYLGNKGSSYRLLVSGGKLCIENEAGTVSGGILPDKTYVDGDAISWEAETTAQGLHIVVKVHPSGDVGTELATTETTIGSVSAS